MGRKRLELKYVKCDKKRNTIYEKRKKGLKKKAYELSTLCDVPVCVVIYKGPNSEPETFPSSNEEVLSLVNRYSSIPVDQRYPKKKGNSDSETAISVYPTWLPVLDGCGIDDLVGFYSFLDSKFRVVAEKIQFLRGDFGGNLMITGGDYDANFASYGGNLMITDNSNADFAGNLMIANNSNAYGGEFGSYQGIVMSSNNSSVCGDATYDYDCEGMQFGSGMDGAGCSYDPSLGYDMMSEYLGSQALPGSQWYEQEGSLI